MTPKRTATNAGGSALVLRARGYGDRAAAFGIALHRLAAMLCRLLCPRHGTCGCASS